MKKRITYAIEPDIIDKLKYISEKTMIPQARLVEKALTKVIEEYEKNLENN